MVTDDTEHSVYSPSSADGWERCTAYIAMNSGKNDEGSDYALEGTAAHWLASESLLRNIDPQDIPETHYTDPRTGRTVELDTTMRRHIANYRATVLSYANGCELHVEQRVPWGEALGLEKFGIEPQYGTADAVVVDVENDELTVIDLKYGQGHRVLAKENRQLLKYASGARYQHSLDFEPKLIRLVIYQPRLSHHDEWTCTTDTLDAFEEEARIAVKLNEEARTLMQDCGSVPAEYFAPGEDACRWCKAKANCAELERHNLQLIIGEFDDETDLESKMDASLAALRHDIPLERLSQLLSAAPLIEGWLKAIRGRVESELFAGKPVPGWKLVEGKSGDRAWTDEEAVEAALKSMRLRQDEMYTFKLISPTQAEKLLIQTPRKWNKLAPFITRSAGKPSVAPESDRRPALSVGATDTDFENLNEVETV